MESCLDSGCSGGCVVLPWNQMRAYRCLCYDGAAEILEDDEKTCASKTYFTSFQKTHTVSQLVEFWLYDWEI